jgi:hypothetical protein
VELGYRFYVDSGRTDLIVPPMNDVLQYYEARAPEELTILPPQEASDGPKPHFERTAIPFPHGPAVFPAVAHLNWVPARRDRTAHLLLCDMCAGEVRQMFAGDDFREPHLLGKVPHPDHAEPCDLDGDGKTDYVVADLGSLLPEDHQRGQVLWIPGANPVAGPRVLWDGLGRVADVQPGDFNGDGKLDLLVAEFGWRTTGRLLLLEQIRGAPQPPQFRLRVLDDRHGIIHTPVLDLDGDGRLDFIALVSQEFETIEAFLNRGSGTFERRLIFAAGDPSFGSSGIQVVDLDGDGDPDVLYTNGDTLDAFCIKPYHAVHWLENRGTFPFEHHLLTCMPGVMRALATDLDGDGDLDVVACAYLPERILRTARQREYDTLIWLEQVAPGRFVRRRLDRSDFGSMALAVGDFNGDGRSDLAVGNYANKTRSEQPWLTLWLSHLESAAGR